MRNTGTGRNAFWQKAKADKNRWDTMDGRRLLEAFLVAGQNGFITEFLDDLLSEREYEQFASRINALHLIHMGTPYSHMTRSMRLSSKTVSKISKRFANERGGYWRVMKKLYPHGYRYEE